MADYPLWQIPERRIEVRLSTSLVFAGKFWLLQGFIVDCLCFLSFPCAETIRIDWCPFCALCSCLYSQNMYRLCLPHCQKNKKIDRTTLLSILIELVMKSVRGPVAACDDHFEPRLSGGLLWSTHTLTKHLLCALTKQIRWKQRKMHWVYTSETILLKVNSRVPWFTYSPISRGRSLVPFCFLLFPFLQFFLVCGYCLECRVELMKFPFHRLMQKSAEIHRLRRADCADNCR